MKRGEVYATDLSPRSGSEQRGRRPVVVVSHDAFNETPGWMSVIVVPVSTSAAQAKRGPTAVSVPRGAGGVRSDSVALCHQLTTIDRGKLGKRLGLLPPEVLDAVGRGLLIAQGFL